MVAGIVSAGWLVGAAALLGSLAGGGTGAWLGAGIGLVVGCVFGYALASARVYGVCARGVFAFLVDHSWSLPNTAVGAVFLTLNLLFGNRLDRDHSRHSSCVHLTNGVLPGYLTTVGTVIAGVHPPSHAHEHGHVLQARIFGPLYLPLVAVSYIVVTLLPYWLIFHDRGRYPIRGVGAYFLQGVYPHTWHEEWCYRRYGPGR